MFDRYDGFIPQNERLLDPDKSVPTMMGISMVQTNE